VQHEYAHEVDFAVLTDPTRATLHTLLRGTSWWGGEGHSELDCERFADLVAWAYWMSPDNVMKPQSTLDEGGQVSPAAFRVALTALLPGVPLVPQPAGQGARETAAAGAARRSHRSRR